MADSAYPTETTFTTAGTDVVNTKIKIQVQDGMTHIGFGLVGPDGRTTGATISLDTDDPFATISLRDLHAVLDRLNDAAEAVTEA